MHVCTYICMVNLETAIQSTKFKNQKHKAVLNVLYSAWWLKTIMSRELKEVGLTHEQYNVLRILKGKYPEELCVKNIGCRMIEKSSNVPRIIDRLVAKKLVKRSTSPTDKRETVISLTMAGLNILVTATGKTDLLFQNTITISETEAAQLNQLLEKLRENE